MEVIEKGWADTGCLSSPLYAPIDVEKSTWKIRTNKVVLTLLKSHPKKWPSVLEETLDQR
eukprot:GABW01001037.1.p2 GENE.GABW01001037.1~~GABW01001037.1.p2  ORF type:complete len:60 (-),score=5.16 GABW01001037.1:130-309(-)